jgi:HSP20 family molecular chaperone IbpA
VPAPDAFRSFPLGWALEFRRVRTNILCYRTDDRLGRTMDPLRTIARAWEELTEGWRQLLSRNSNALTHFVSGARKDPKAGSAPDFPQWGLLAAETWETAGTLIVRIEVPGMDKDDFDVSIHGNTLRIRGEKRSEDNHHERKYHLMERAYGRFERRRTSTGTKPKSRTGTAF